MCVCQIYFFLVHYIEGYHPISNGPLGGYDAMLNYSE
jgi:hypothetical protein